MVTLVEWIHRLEAKIEAQRKYIEPFEQRYSNDYVLPFLVREYQEVYPGIIVSSPGGGAQTVKTLNFGSTLDVPRTGTAGVIVDALAERLVLEGLGSADDLEVSKKLQLAWEGNDLDVMHHEAHREALIGGRSYASIARESSGDRAVVGIESATQVAIAREQFPPYDVTAGLKVWTDEWTGAVHGLLRMPGVDYRLVKTSEEMLDPDGSGLTTRWRIESKQSTGLSGVGFVEFAHRARLLKEPSSEIDRLVTAIDILDLIEGLMVFAGHFGAVPIRYGTGLELTPDPDDPSKPLLGPDGKPALGFVAKANAFWGNTGEHAKFGQLTPAGLTSFVEWADHVAGVVRRQTKLPSAYFSLDLKSHMSADLLKTDEAPMLRRVLAMGRDGSLNASWRKLGQLILEIEAPGERVPVQPRWVNPETRLESQTVDQFTKLVASGLGVATTAEKVLGWDQETIDKAVKEARGDQVGFNPDFVADFFADEELASAGLSTAAA